MIKILNRTANVPEYDRTIGCLNDNLVEERLFYVYDMDLKDFDFKLSVKQSGDSTENVIDLDKTIYDDVIILKWTIERAHLKQKGKMLAQLYGFKAVGGDIKKWHTLNFMEFMVNPTINALDAFTATYPSEVEQIQARITTYKDEAAVSAAMAASANASALNAKAAAESAKAEAVSAKDDAVSAKEAAVSAKTAAEAVAVKTPYIGENGNWFVWNVAENKFKDSQKTSFGKVPSITVGTVTSVESFENAAVTRRSDSTDENPVFDFAIPRGASGVYVGSGKMPDGFNVQIDPNGSAAFMEIEAGSLYDLVINNQAEFDELIGSTNFLNAKNILICCDVYITSVFNVPSTVKSISGFNSTITIISEGSSLSNYDEFDFGPMQPKEFKI